MEVLPADRFTFEQLTDAYNQTRVDYLVPMPMNVARLREYAHVYDVNLPCSCVAMEGETMLGLGMLGMRHGRSWITRLGVLPSGRRKGAGDAIMTWLIDHSTQNSVDAIWLEVIKGNDPAHQLFRKYGFSETRDLIVARRPPGTDIGFQPSPIASITNLDHEDALILLAHRRQPANWLNQSESLQNVRNLSALQIEMANGGKGWVTYHAGLLQLTRILVEVIQGDPVEVTANLLHALHDRHKRQDAVTENLANDAVWQGFQAIGYFESFRRIEMVKPMKS